MTRRPRLLLFALLVSVLSGCVRARGPDPEALPPVRDVRLTVEARVEEIPPDASELRLWIPVPRDEPAQIVTRVVPETPDAKMVADPKLGNPALLVVLPKPASAAGASATFEISRAEQRGKSGHPVAHPEKTKDPEQWLADERLTFVDDRLREIAAQIHAGKKTHREKARAAYEYVFENMQYSKEGTGWGTGSVAWACDYRYGNCTDFHALFIALARAGGVPARFRIGFSLPADAKEGTLPGYHCWAEWWDEGAGWIPVDISEAWKNPAKKEYFFGNLDRDRVGVSLGRDLVFEGQQGPPLNYFVFPYAEVDGKPVRVATTVTFREAR